MKTNDLLKTVLPYLFGGAVLFVVWRKIFNNDVSERILNNGVSVKSKFLLMSPKEKDVFFLKCARDLKEELLWSWGAFGFSNKSAVALLNSYTEEMLIGIGKVYKEFRFHQKLSIEIRKYISSEELSYLNDVMMVLEENNL